MIGKRGQGGSGAAVLVAIIAGLIILYILFLGPSDREDLLGESHGSSSKKSSEENNITVLIDEKPGRLDYLSDNEFEIDIPSFNLYKTTSAKEIESFNDFSVRNGWFDKKDIEKSFSLTDLENTDNIILSFIAKTHKGRLSIDLNDNNIFDGVIDTQNVEPIKLPKSYLQNGENKIKFSVSSVGAAFWKTNEFNFGNAKIIGDITDLSKQKTRNVFTIEAWKYNNLDKATLKFNPDCRQSEAGTIDVLINNKNVFSGVPDCGMLNRYEVPTGNLNAGINDVVFMTNSGSYLIDQIKVKLELQELTSPLYWFDINDDQLENVTKGLWDCNLSIKFVDDDEDKTLDINVNGHMKRIDQDEPKFEYNLNDWIEEGRNYIKLIPKTTVDIVSLRIRLIEREDEED